MANARRFKERSNGGCTANNLGHLKPSEEVMTSRAPPVFRTPKPAEEQK
jgi:hypothetical protein